MRRRSDRSSGRHTAFSTCPLCEATCGIAVDVEPATRRIAALRGDADDAFSRGHVCAKVVGLRDLQDDSDRIRRPLRRTRGGAFEEIGWDDALALAAERLGAVRDAHGADAVALYRGNPGIHDFATLLGANVVSRALGSKHVFSAGATDTWPRYVQSASMYGGPLRATVPDVDRTDFLLVVGANPLVSNGSLMTAPGLRERLAALRARGGRLVVVDPRRTETAERADAHHFIVPGTDAAFLLAVVHTLFAEGRVALGRAAEHVAGLDDVERIAADFAPERVAPFCGIDAGAIRALARDLAEAPSAATYGRMGTCVQEFGTLASWGVDLVAILTGSLDRPGGNMWTKPAAPLHAVFEAGGAVRFGRWQSRTSGHDEILGELPAPVLAEEILAGGEGGIRALVTIAGNPARTYPNSGRLERALASLAFMVSLDYYRNETTRHADLILPPNAPLERGHYDLALNHFAVRNVAKWSDPVLAPEPGARSAWDVSLELGRRLMGLDALAPEQVDALVLRQFAGLALGASRFAERLSVDDVLAAAGDAPGPERVLDVMLRLGPWGDGFGQAPEGLSLARLREHPHGVDLGPLEPMLPEPIRTGSGRIELAPERIVADLPRLDAAVAAPRAGLRLVNRRDVRSMNSWLHNLPSLAKGRDRCTLAVHPEDAARHGLADGGFARISGAAGDVIAPVEVTDSVMPGVVSLPHGYGHAGDGVELRVASAKPGANVNAITDDLACDAPSGAAMLFGQTVTVEPVAGL